MNPNNLNLEELAQAQKIRIHEPFAEFLHAQPSLHSFDLSLLDCYRFAGHACHAITGAFLVTQKAVEQLFPEKLICERGDLSVAFGSGMDESATGPRSNVVSFLTGAWAESGFPGLRGQFRRKDLVSYNAQGISKMAIRFHRLSTQKEIVVEYDPSETIKAINHQLDFPESWRLEICSILLNSGSAIRIC